MFLLGGLGGVCLSLYAVNQSFAVLAEHSDQSPIPSGDVLRGALLGGKVGVAMLVVGFGISRWGTAVEKKAKRRECSVESGGDDLSGV